MLTVVWVLVAAGASGADLVIENINWLTFLLSFTFAFSVAAAFATAGETMMTPERFDDAWQQAVHRNAQRTTSITDLQNVHASVRRILLQTDLMHQLIFSFVVAVIQLVGLYLPFGVRYALDPTRFIGLLLGTFTWVRVARHWASIRQ